jgi:hypothetical protein
MKMVGFATASRQHVRPTLNQILSESVNNTLNNDCPRASQAEKEKNTWLSVFAPSILKRLAKAAPKAKLDEDDVFNLMAMCPFESLAIQKRSSFCGLFTKKEFASFEYHGDVEKYYKTGSEIFQPPPNFADQCTSDMVTHSGQFKGLVM